MKKSIILCFLFFGCFMCGLAQKTSATLQHGDETFVFYGYQSFADAYEQSSDGDVITLSCGNFNSIKELDKSITIVGNYAFSKNDSITSINEITVTGDNVTLTGIRFVNTLKMELTSNLKIKRCYIENLIADTTHTSTLIEDCAINNDYSLPNGINESYRRSDIARHHRGNTPDNLVIFDHCIIHSPFTEQVDITYHKGVKHWNTQLASYGIYTNCAIFSKFMEPGQSTAQAPLYLNQQSEYYDVMLYGGYYGTVSFVIRDGTIANHISGKFMDDESLNKIKFPSFFTDEIVIPLEGGTEYTAPVGCIGHKAWPAIPRIIESNIDKETDSNGNLNIFVKLSTEN